MFLVFFCLRLQSIRSGVRRYYRQMNIIVNTVQLEECSNNYVSEYVRGRRSPIFNWTEGMAWKYITGVCQIAKRPVRLTSTVKCTLIYPPGIYVVAIMYSCIYTVYKCAGMRGTYIGHIIVYQFNDTYQCSWKRELCALRGRSPQNLRRELLKLSIPKRLGMNVCNIFFPVDLALLICISPRFTCSRT